MMPGNKLETKILTSKSDEAELDFENSRRNSSPERELRTFHVRERERERS